MRILIVSVLALLLVGCTCFQDLEEGNELAMENQANLEKNSMRAIENVRKLGEATGEWTEEDQAIWATQRDTLAEQLAINHAWLLLLDEAIRDDDIEAKLFANILEDLPDWIKEGKDLYDLIKDKKDN